MGGDRDYPLTDEAGFLAFATVCDRLLMTWYADQMQTLVVEQAEVQIALMEVMHLAQAFKYAVSACHFGARHQACTQSCTQLVVQPLGKQQDCNFNDDQLPTIR